MMYCEVLFGNHHCFYNQWLWNIYWKL